MTTPEFALKKKGGGSEKRSEHTSSVISLKSWLRMCISPQPRTGVTFCPNNWGRGWRNPLQAPPLVSDG